MIDHTAAAKMAREAVAWGPNTPDVEMGLMGSQKHREALIAAAYLDVVAQLHSLRPCDSDHEAHCANWSQPSACDCFYGAVRRTVDSIIGAAP